MFWKVFKHLKGCLSWLMDLARDHFLLAMIGLYFILVFVFATVNWMLFLNNSTAFLISEQLNKHLDRYEFLQPDIDLAAYHKNAKDSMPITISDFSNMIRSDLDKLQTANDSLRIKNEAMEKCTLQWKSLSRIASEMRNDSVNEVRENLLSGYQERIDSLKLYLDGKDSTQMIIDGKYLELAKMQYEYAKKNAKVQDMSRQYIGNFIPDSLSHQIRRCNEDYILLTFDIMELERERKNVTSIIKQSATDFHNNRLESVGWVDFVYYSICVSTTVSFGDLAPNNGTTRLVAILELLICLFLVGYIVDRIIKKKD